MQIVGTKNAGFEILEAIEINEKTGYVLAESPTQFVTWLYYIRGNGISYNLGHYFIKDPDIPNFQNKARAKHDLFERANNAIENLIGY